MRWGSRFRLPFLPRRLPSPLPPPPRNRRQPRPPPPPPPPRKLPPASTGATGPIIRTAPRNIGFVTFPKTTAVNYSFTDAPTPPFVPVAPQRFGVRPGE